MSGSHSSVAADLALVVVASCSVGRLSGMTYEVSPTGSGVLAPGSWTLAVSHVFSVSNRLTNPHRISFGFLSRLNHIAAGTA